VLYWADIRHGSLCVQIGEQPDMSDLRDVDTFFADSMKQLLEMPEEEYEASFADQVFTTLRTDGVTVPLKPGGEEICVPYVLFAV